MRALGVGGVIIVVVLVVVVVSSRILRRILEGFPVRIRFQVLALLDPPCTELQLWSLHHLLIPCPSRLRPFRSSPNTPLIGYYEITCFWLISNRHDRIP